MKKNTISLMALGIFTMLSGIISIKENKVMASSDSTLALANDYYVNDYLEIPENIITDNGKNYESISYVTYPNGAMYQTSEVTFKDAGEYTITYVAKQNPSIKESFVVKALDRKYHFASDTITKSSATYGIDSSKYKTDIEGLTVKLYAGETFYYDEIIDLNACQDNSTCDFIKFFALPETAGKMDLERVHMRLTDTVDDSIYLDIYVFPYPVRSEPEDVKISVDENWKYFDTFIRVGGQNQVATGLDWKADGSCSINKTNLSGFAAAHSMYGYSNYYKGYNQPRVCTVGKEILNMGFNMETLEFNSTHRISGRSNVVCDLDDVNYVEEPWCGFTNGKVKLSIEGFMYRDAINIPFTFMITELGNNDLSKGNIIDNEGPIISVSESNETCYVNNYYKIPEATITDTNSKIKSSITSVFYNYNSSTEYELDVEDGYFIPNKKGIYTIEYKAKDYFNNETIYKYRVNATEGNPADYQITLPTSTFNFNAGDTCSLVKPTISKENVKLERIFTLNGKEIKLTESNYKFESAGTYKLTYIATDIYKKEKKIEATYIVAGNQKPIFEGNPNLPKYLVEGGKYLVTPFIAYDYNNGKKELNSIVSVDCGNGFEIITGDIFEINAIGTVEEIEIRYVASNEYGSTSITYTIPYVNLKKNKTYDLTRLIAGDNFNTASTEEYIEVSAASSNDDTTFDIVNPLNAEDLSITFKIDKNKASFDSITLTIVDYENPTIKQEFTIAKNGDNSSKFIVNGITYSMSAGFKNDATISLSYSNNTKILRSSDFNIFLSKDASGNPFDGFLSNKCYVSFKLNNVYGASGIILSKLNAQTLTDTDMDYVKPTIITSGKYNTQYNKDEIITIYKSEGIDVIDPTPTTTLTIRHFEGYQTSDVNGLLLVDVDATKDYQIKLENYGTYIVEYTAIDASKRKNQFMYSFEVIDNIAPAFNIENKVFNVKVNEAIDIHNVVVTDNVDTDITYTINLTLPNGEMVDLDKTLEGVKFSKAGTYFIRFYAIDSSNNVSVITYRVNVK